MSFKDKLAAVATPEEKYESIAGKLSVEKGGSGTRKEFTTEEILKAAEEQRKNPIKWTKLNEDRKTPESILPSTNPNKKDDKSPHPLIQAKEKLVNIITQGYQSWDNIMKNPGKGKDAISDAKAFYNSIKDLPFAEQIKVIDGVYMDVVLDVKDKLQDASQEMIKKGVDMAEDLYDMTPQQRTQFLSNLQKDGNENGNGNINIKGLTDSLKAFYDLPMEEKVTLFKNLEDKTMTTLTQGAKKLYNVMKSK